MPTDRLPKPRPSDYLINICRRARTISACLTLKCSADETFGLLHQPGRGQTVDEGALAEALRERRIAGAGFDVFQPNRCRRKPILAIANVFITPHVGVMSSSTRIS